MAMPRACRALGISRHYFQTHVWSRSNFAPGQGLLDIFGIQGLRARRDQHRAITPVRDGLGAIDDQVHHDLVELGYVGVILRTS